VVSVTPHPHFAPGKWPPIPILQEAGWAPEPVWTQKLEEKSFAPSGDQTPVVQSVVRHYTAWATSALISNRSFKIRASTYTFQSQCGPPIKKFGDPCNRLSRLIFKCLVVQYHIMKKECIEASKCNSTYSGPALKMADVRSDYRYGYFNTLLPPVETTCGTRWVESWTLPAKPGSGAYILKTFLWRLWD
jgi:hypothetical protein